MNFRYRISLAGFIVISSALIVASLGAPAYVGILMLVGIALIFYAFFETRLQLRQAEARIRQRAEKIAEDAYREGEALQNLLLFVRPRAPLWGLRGYAGSPDLLLHIHRIIGETRPKLVVELGSGISTVIASYALEADKSARLLSLEHEENHVEQTKSRLRLHGFSGENVVRHAPIRTTVIDGASYPWYSPEALSDIKSESIDLLVIDGPPAPLGARARLPSLQHLGPLMKPGATVIFDDADRADERSMIAEWRKAFPESQIRWLPSEKGLAVLSLGSRSVRA